MMIFCLGCHSAMMYGPHCAGSCVVNFFSGSFSTAALGRMVPDSDEMAISHNGANGDLSLITPLYLSLTTTLSSVGQRPPQSVPGMRSNENLTSSAVTSP